MKVDIKDIKDEMIIKFPFFNNIISNIEYVESDMIPSTGATEDNEGNRKIFYNPNYFEKLTSEEKVFVLAHETCHLAFNHLKRSEGKNLEVWNKATDSVINSSLKRENLKMPEGGIDIKDAYQYDAETLYDRFMEKEKNIFDKNEISNEEEKSGQSQDSSSSSNGESNQKDEALDKVVDELKKYVNDDNSNFSAHSMWNNNNKKDEISSQSKDSTQENKSNQNNDKTEKTNSEKITDLKEYLEKLKQEIDSSKYIEDKDNSLKSGSKNNNNNCENKQNNKQDDLEKEIEKISKLGEKKFFEKNRISREEQLRELKEEIINQASGYGNYTNSEVRSFKSIGRAKPLLDWRYLLRETTKYDVDWSYKNAYIEDGIIHSTLLEQPMPETEIVLDTSGSVSETLLRNFLRECKNIMEHSKIKVGCFDTMFYGFEEIRTEHDIEELNFVGFGGTDFNAAINAFTKRVDNKIIFTDGEAPIPSKSVDAIWLVYGNTEINPKGGKVIYIDEESINKLLNFDTKSKSKVITRK